MESNGYAFENQSYPKIKLQLDQFFKNSEKILDKIPSDYKKRVYLNIKENEKRIKPFLSLNPNLIKLRAQIIDKLINKCNTFNQSDSTLFLAIKILDCIISKFQKIELTEMYLIMVTSLFMASKIEEVTPLKMKVLVDFFSKEDIIAKELFILKELNYKLPKVNFMDMINIFIERYSSYGNRKSSENSTGSGSPGSLGSPTNISIENQNPKIIIRNTLIFLYSKIIYKAVLILKHLFLKFKDSAIYSFVFYYSVIFVNKKLNIEESYLVSNLERCMRIFDIKFQEVYDMYSIFLNAISEGLVNKSINVSTEIKRIEEIINIISSSIK